MGSTAYVADLVERTAGSTRSRRTSTSTWSARRTSSRFVYDGDLSDSAPPPAGRPRARRRSRGCSCDYFDSQGLANEPTAFDGRSDYGPFIANGVPAGGLFSGAEGIKTAEQEAIYGGVAGLVRTTRATTRRATRSFTPRPPALRRDGRRRGASADADARPVAAARSPRPAAGSQATWTDGQARAQGASATARPRASCDPAPAARRPRIRLARPDRRRERAAMRAALSRSCSLAGRGRLRRAAVTRWRRPRSSSSA